MLLRVSCPVQYPSVIVGKNFCGDNIPTKTSRNAYKFAIHEFGLMVGKNGITRQLVVVMAT